MQSRNGKSLIIFPKKSTNSQTVLMPKTNNWNWHVNMKFVPNVMGQGKSKSKLHLMTVLFANAFVVKTIHAVMMKSNMNDELKYTQAEYDALQSKIDELETIIKDKNDEITDLNDKIEGMQTDKQSMLETFENISDTIRETLSDGHSSMVVYNK